MKRATVKEAAQVAREFIKRCDIVLKDGSDSEYFFGSKDTGALRRTSMELTRALAQMRKP